MNTNILYRKISHELEQSYSYSTDIPFTMPLHSHAEYELIYIVSGHGQEYVGDSVKAYVEGDLVLIGGNVPHLHLCNSLIENSSNKKSVCNILHFPRNIFPSNLADTQEYTYVELVLERSLKGVKFRSRGVIESALRIMNSINKMHGIDRVVGLLKLLDILGRSNDITSISTIPHSPESIFTNLNEPINRVFTYLINNFKQDITLSLVANYVKLNPSSLCRYFKQMTGKTLFACLNEIRIEHACRLLTQSQLTISQVAYEVGFNNLSHFNKQFKGVTNQTPTEFRKHISGVRLNFTK